MDKVLGFLSPDRIIPDDFGVLVTADNMETHLQTLRATKDQYYAQHPEDVAQINELTRKALFSLGINDHVGN